MTKATKPPKVPAIKVVELKTLKDETRSQALARHTLMPELQAGMTMTLLNGSHPEADVMAFADELRKQSEAVSSGNLERGEAMLTAQAHTLDALFHMLAERSRLNMREYPGAAETFMRLAFKAQSQCRSTWEAIAEIKNPRQVAFVRQANMGQNVQVNNGAALSSRARENENSPTEVLEANDGERMDTGTTGAAGGSDQELEAVGAINRAKDCSG